MDGGDPRGGRHTSNIGTSSAGMQSVANHLGASGHPEHQTSRLTSKDEEAMATFSMLFLCSLNSHKWNA